MIVTLSDNRHDDALEIPLGLKLRQRLRGIKASAVAPRVHPGGGGMRQAWPGDPLHGRRRRHAEPGARRPCLPVFARPARPSRCTFRITALAGYAFPSRTRDLTGALAVNPMLLELFDYLSSVQAIGRLVRQCSPGAVQICRIPTPSPWRGSSPGLTQTNTRLEPHPTDISWPREQKLHYSLNHAARVRGCRTRGFSPTLKRFVCYWRPDAFNGRESDQGP